MPDTAELIWSIHQPWKATLAECLGRWSRLDPGTRATSWLVVHASEDRRHTLDATQIAAMVDHRNIDHKN